MLGGSDDADLLAQVRSTLASARTGTAPAPSRPSPETLGASVRAAVDYADAADLAGKLEKLEKALTSGNPALFRMLRQQGVFVGRGPAPKVAFLYTGQGSQYVNMLQGLHGREPVIAETFAEADQVMTPLLGRSLTSYIFVDGDDPTARAEAEQRLLQTEITQPAVLATDLALTRLLAAFDVRPDMVMGHSLGEYGALVAAGALSFESALEAVSARGHEMASLSVEDNGAMAAVFGPLPEIERIVGEADGYVVIANINSTSQAVIGGATTAVERIIETFTAAGINAVRIPVSHAFHTSIVAPASVPLVAALRRLDLRGPQLPCVANVTGDFYPSGADTETMLDLLGRQVASPVQFVRGLHSLYEAGARVFVEVGPKKALHGFVDDVLASTTTSRRSSPTTPSSTTRAPSTRRCAACTPPASVASQPRRTRSLSPCRHPRRRHPPPRSPPWQLTRPSTSSACCSRACWSRACGSTATSRRRRPRGRRLP